MDRIIYLDNAATSWPKPEAMMDAMATFNSRTGANPGRSGHTLSIEAARVILDARQAVASLLGIPDLLRVVFMKNATEALNTVIYGLFRDGGHVITSSMEHNSVMRPLRNLEAHGTGVSIAQCSASGELDPQDIARLIRKDTKAIILTHASNVTGTVMPIAEAGALARERGILLCVDASQSAGALPIDVKAMNIDLLAFTGHKSLFGPQGTGGLFMKEGLEEMIEPLMQGGTGSRSEFEEQPDFMPDRYESGTPNAIGIAGLGAGVRFILETGIDAILAKKKQLTSRLISGLSSIEGVHVYGPQDAEKQAAVVSFNIAGMSPSDVSLALDSDFKVMARPGLHCAPSAHKTIGTFPQGTVRFSPGFFTTSEEIDLALQAVRTLASSKKGEERS